MDIEALAAIRRTMDGLSLLSGVVNLNHHLFDRLPCTRRQLYSAVRKYGDEWGYDYQPAEYVPSGNRPFQRNHKRGQRRSPHAIRRKEK